MEKVREVLRCIWEETVGRWESRAGGLGIWKELSRSACEGCGSGEALEILGAWDSMAFFLAEAKNVDNIQKDALIRESRQALIQ